jgi:triosephosphate isomerase
MSEKIWIGTGWKMNKTIAEARAYAAELATATIPDSVQPFILPPHTALAAVRDELPKDSPVLIGAQNAHWAAEGAQTGEISMRMAADAGATLIEMGHSERRANFGETDETVGLKARAALDAGLTPLICVGESIEVRDAGRADEFILGQVRGAVALLSASDIAGVIVAYEPIWAIGEHGRPATAEETAPVMAAIANELDSLSGGTGCRALLYGGSVNQENAAGLLLDPNTDGLFVGRAAWSPEGLLALIQIADHHAAIAFL